MSSFKDFWDGTGVRLFELHTRFFYDWDSTSKSGKSLWMINDSKMFSNSLLLTLHVFPQSIVDWLEAVHNFGIFAKISGASLIAPRTKVSKDS